MKTQRVVKVILNTELVKINDVGNEYQVLITMSQGGVIEHEPFKRDLQGLVNALQLATEICAGKFFPRRMLTQSEFQVVDPLRIESQASSLINRK